MTTFSPYKGYSVPTVGADTNAWGTELNTTLGLIDSNIGGETNVSVGGNANVTLSTPQAAFLLINLTGALTGNIEVFFPGSKGFYFVNNATSGAFTLTLGSTGGGSTVVLEQGSIAIVFTDGTNVIQVPVGNDVVANNLTANGSASLLGALTVALTATFNGSVTMASSLAVANGLTALNGVALGGVIELTATTLAAAGTTQATATLLSGVINYVTSGSGGVRFPYGTQGQILMVSNGLTGALNLYPASGAYVQYAGQSPGVNVAVSVPTIRTLLCANVGNGAWVCTG